MPANKVYNIMDIIAQELAAKHIIDDKENVIDQNAFFKFIAIKEYEFKNKLANIESDGVISADDRYIANYFSSVLEYLDIMRKLKGLRLKSVESPEYEQRLCAPIFKTPQQLQNLFYKTKHKIQSLFQKQKVN